MIVQISNILLSNFNTKQYDETTGELIPGTEPTYHYHIIASSDDNTDSIICIVGDTAQFEIDFSGQYSIETEIPINFKQRLLPCCAGDYLTLSQIIDNYKEYMKQLVNKWFNESELSGIEITLPDSSTTRVDSRPADKTNWLALESRYKDNPTTDIMYLRDYYDQMQPITQQFYVNNVAPEIYAGYDAKYGEKWTLKATIDSATELSTLFELSWTEGV